MSQEDQPCCSKSLWTQSSMEFEDSDSLQPELDNDCLQSIMSYLPLKDRVRCERVSKSWKMAASSLLRGQKAIGNQATNLCNVDKCENSRHWVTSLDILPKQTLTNLCILPKVLQKFPELRAIAITRSKEPTFSEAANAKRQATDREEEARDADSGQQEDMGQLLEEAEERNIEVEFVDGQAVMPEYLGPDEAQDITEEMEGQERMMMEFFNDRNRYRFGPHPESRNSYARRRLVMIMNKKKKTNPAPRPTCEEDFLDIIAKYASHLECIDVSGLKLTRGYRAGTDEAGSWKMMAENLGRTLVHIKTLYMRDKELKFLLENCPVLTDVSIVHGLKGDHLNCVGKHFQRMSIASVKDSGLTRLSEAEDLSSFRSLSLCNVNKGSINVLTSKLTMIHTLNLSLSMYNVTPFDLMKLRQLSSLRSLYIKRKTISGQFDGFDTPFTEILNRCNLLETIRLTNMVVTDESMRHIFQALPRLKRLEIKCDVSRVDKTLSDRTLMSLSELSQLQKLHIDYPNTFTENTLIDFLFRAFKLKYLLIHGCKEMIMIREILHAAVKQASAPERQMASLVIDIDTREKMILPVGSRTSIRPVNLRYTISTGEDFWSTHHALERPSTETTEEDFDEHEAFIFGQQE